MSVSHPGTAPLLEPYVWIILFIAGLLEVVWAVGLKYTHGFSRLLPSVITIAAMVVSMALLSWAMKSLPVGTAYAVWWDRRRWRSDNRHRAAGRIRKPDAYREPRLYCDRHYRAENQCALIALVNPNQFAYVEALPGGDIQHLLFHLWRNLRRARQ